MSEKLASLDHLKLVSMRSADMSAKVAKAAADAIEEIAGVKADKAEFVGLTLLPSGWVSNTDEETLTAGYKFACSVAVAEATAKDSAECIIPVAEGAKATACGMSPSTDVIDGQIVFYAVEAPTENITIQARLIEGAAEKEAE